MFDQSDQVGRGHVHVAWAQFQRRQHSIAAITGMECVFLQRTTRNGLLATGLDYCSLAWRTWRLLQSRRPQVLWIQLPPVALLWVALLARRLFLPHLKLIADCHNAMFRRPWSSIPGGLRWLERCDAVLVHNEEVHRVAVELGVSRARLRVLEDVPPQVTTMDSGALASQYWDRPRPWIVMPGSFSHDEPILELARAAARMPEATFFITGRTERAARYGHGLDDLPPNVVTPGYLERSEFERLLHASDLVLALTRVEGIQLSVCNEALGFGKAMVASDTKVLRSMFGSACELAADHQPDTLIACFRRALARKDALERQARDLAQARTQAWKTTQYKAVLTLLNEESGAGEAS